MEKQIDLLKYLSRIVRENTRHYQSDLAYDRKALQQAARAHEPRDRAFYWMSRPNGTWCVKERETFIRGSSAYSIWTHYADVPEGIMAYRLWVTGYENGAVWGTVHPLSYREQVRRVQAHAVLARPNALHCEGGHVEPEDESALDLALAAERRAEKKDAQKKRRVPIR